MKAVTYLLFSFEGRINRAKFWGGEVLIVLIYVLALIIARTGEGAAVLALVIAIPVMLWASFAVGIKRYHDRDKSGAWVLIQFVPLIGGLWYLIECGFMEGTMGPNQYGDDPLVPDQTATEVDFPADHRFRQ